MTIVSDALDKLFATVVKDELAVVQPVADTYLNSIIANPSPDNVMAQSLAFVPNATAALPNMQAVGAKDAATALKALVDSLVPSLVAQAATVIATAAAGKAA